MLIINQDENKIISATANYQAKIFGWKQELNDKDKIYHNRGYNESNNLWNRNYWHNSNHIAQVVYKKKGRKLNSSICHMV